MFPTKIAAAIYLWEKVLPEVALLYLLLQETDGKQTVRVLFSLERSMFCCQRQIKLKEVFTFVSVSRRIGLKFKSCDDSI